MGRQFFKCLLSENSWSCLDIYPGLTSMAIRFCMDWRGGRAVEGARLESVCTLNRVPRVRIPLSPKLYKQWSML